MSVLSIENAIKLAKMKAAKGHDEAAPAKPSGRSTRAKPVSVDNGFSVEQLQRLAALYPDDFDDDDNPYADDWPQAETAEQERLRHIYSGESR